MNCFVFCLRVTLPPDALSQNLARGLCYLWEVRGPCVLPLGRRKTLGGAVTPAATKCDEGGSRPRWRAKYCGISVAIKGETCAHIMASQPMDLTTTLSHDISPYDSSLAENRGQRES